MDLLAKRKTAAQIAPVSQPLAVIGPYALATVAMVLRDAGCMFAVSGLRLKSTHERGHTPAILAAVGGLSTRTIWFEQGDDPTWRISLGLWYCGLRFIDWNLQFAVSGDGMSITTLNALTSDDELVNAESTRCRTRRILLRRSPGRMTPAIVRALPQRNRSPYGRPLRYLSSSIRRTRSRVGVSIPPTTHSVSTVRGSVLGVPCRLGSGRLLIRSRPAVPRRVFLQPSHLPATRGFRACLVVVP